MAEAMGVSLKQKTKSDRENFADKRQRRRAARFHRHLYAGF